MAIRRSTAAPAPAVGAFQPPPPPPMGFPPAIQQQFAAPPSMLVGEDLPIGEMGFFSQGFNLPPGKYVIFNIDIKLHKHEKDKSNAPRRLGGMITLIPLADLREEAKHEQFYSLGSKAHMAYAPNATGKGIKAIPGATEGTVCAGSTNYGVFLANLYECGLPPGVFKNDVSVIEGTWIETGLIDEPAERGTYAKAETEIEPAPRTPKKIAVPLAILEGGKPWEGSGGWPDTPQKLAQVQALLRQAPTPVRVAAPAFAPPVIQIPAAPAAPAFVQPPPPPAPPAATLQGLDLQTQAQSCISDVLTKNLNGLPFMTLRVETYNAATGKYGLTTASNVITQVIDTPLFDTVVGMLGYKRQGDMVVPAA